MDVQIDKANLDYVLKYLPPKNKYKLIILEVLEDGNVPRCKIIGFVKYKPEDSGKRPVNKNKAISYKNSKPEALPGR